MVKRLRHNAQALQLVLGGHFDLRQLAVLSDVFFDKFVVKHRQTEYFGKGCCAVADVAHHKQRLAILRNCRLQKLGDTLRGCCNQCIAEFALRFYLVGKKLHKCKDVYAQADTSKCCKKSVAELV